MENKIKASLATLLTLLVIAGLVYGILRNVQFIGILLMSMVIMALTMVLYKFFNQYFNSKNNKNN